jgi:hypothetical protein
MSTDTPLSTAYKASAAAAAAAAHVDVVCVAAAVTAGAAVALLVIRAGQRLILVDAWVSAARLLTRVRKRALQQARQVLQCKDVTCAVQQLCELLSSGQRLIYSRK